MCLSSKLSMLLALLLIVAFTACTPAATPVPPTPTSTNPPPTDTIAPTATIAPKPTSTPGPIGGKFDAGGVKLNLICLGQGTPTVVFDSAWGMGSSSWAKIVRELRDHVRVCAYDRASIEASDTQSGLRTSGQMMEQLHTLLKNANVDGPYLVVGHSLGGMNVLVFADRYRDEVAGLVLVDSSHPDQMDRWSAIMPTPAPDESAGLADLRKELAAGWANPDDPSFPEPMNWDETLAQVRAVKSLGGLPLAVLVRVDPIISGWGDIPPELALRLEKVWLDLHKEYLGLSADSSLVLAKKSGHFIQDDKPQLVIDAILNLVDQVRQK